MLNKTSLVLLLFLLLFFQLDSSSANDEKFCLLYTLAPEHETINEFDDCINKLSETNKEINIIKKSGTELPEVSNELISCEKRLIERIKDLEDLKELANQNTRTDSTEISALQDSALNN